ncbi:SIR2 family protein [Methanosarcina sp. Z-7115]|uniref:SIR2 family protein n=1 Tax=Methanosarcina baikalica TaxID=3073890 RepID=A0ABU2D3C9_9EURY|nr:SIR2 family protein [Methanosarcina sp. Z-7115]MDR7666495.1 SIR2 family protein [Methanosarcina sp. Z-7115]
MDSVIFPDQIHIEQIKKRLWCGREFGQAAVMIGAGFSKNADTASYNAPSFPLWKELADGMYGALYPSSSDSTDDRLRATSGEGASKLALEYETMFGRSALDNYLLKSIDDGNYHPGELHKLLLSLPWSDVFTTNYDTLLERTRVSIYERKYDLVETLHDMPGKMKPRIVKLHGSFPSHRPYIITEEDFRTYPKKFAPFVNMVQQSMMENAFCLLGFSGDDPNFLSWSGWVRDNLGESKPPIYLCGLLELSPSKRKLLENRGVVPIDLSQKFPKSDVPENIRYKEAINWFLKELQNGKPPNPLKWPKKSRGHCHPFDQNFKAYDLKEICKIWSGERKEYPGWVIAPKKNRDIIWNYTKYWIDTVFNSIETLPDLEKFFLLYELNWRLEITLTPLFSNWTEIISQTVEKFNPFPSYMEIPNASIKADQIEYKSLDWERIRVSWVELAFALVREARENHNEECFLLWINRLECLLSIQKDWKARLFYEKCLFFLFKSNQEEVRKCLESWPQIDDLPSWETKRASILAELGNLDEAEKIAERALQKVRLQIQPYEIDCLTLSQEGLIMFLLKYIKENSSDIEDFVGEYRDRWDKLETYRCNPNSQIESLILNVGQIRLPLFEKENTSSSQWTFTILPAFSFLRMFEEVGLPVRCGSIAMYPNSVDKSSILISPYAPLWALSFMVRTGRDEGIKKQFNQIQVALLTPEEVDLLYKLFTNSLKQAVKYLELNPIECHGNSYSVTQIELASGMLSRLCICLSTDQLDQLFSLSVDIYNTQIFRNHDFLHDCITNIFEMLLRSMPQYKIIEKMPDLLSLPIPTESGFECENQEHWPEPFTYVKWSENAGLKSSFDRSLWSKPISNLISIVENGTPESRNRAVLRLAKLHEINGLNGTESKLLGDALWGRVDPRKGIPGETQLSDSSYLLLPEIREGIAKENFHKYLISKDFPRVVLRSQTAKTFSMDSHTELVKYIKEWLRGTKSQFPWYEEENKKLEDWTTEEMIHLLDTAISWWNEEKYELHENTHSISIILPNLMRKQFGYLVQLISQVILPRLGPVSGDVKDRVKNLLSDMEKFDICVLRALPMTLFIEPENYDEVLQKIRFGLNSAKEEEIHEIIFGLFNWIILGNMGKIRSPPNDLLDELINRTVARRQPGLESVIECVSSIVRRLPDLFTEKQTESLIIALQYLIKETELPDKKDLYKTKYSLFLIDELPTYRKLSAELSFWIFQKFKIEVKAIPPIVMDWKEACLKDPFPQIRKIWAEQIEEETIH